MWVKPPSSAADHQDVPSNLGLSILASILLVVFISAPEPIEEITLTGAIAAVIGGTVLGVAVTYFAERFLR